MEKFACAGLLLLAATASSGAQEAVPDLKGQWSGVARSVVVGSGYHHPGKETLADRPRIRELRFTYTVEAQDGRLLWGKTTSPYYEEPFAWAIARDNRTIHGSDTDGRYLLNIIGADQMELCYSHDGQSPSKSIVSSCFLIDRVKP